MRQTGRKWAWVSGALLAAFVLATMASAQTGGNEGLSPTLSAIKNAHVVRLGYREPFSFIDPANRPIDYSIEAPPHNRSPRSQKHLRKQDQREPEQARGDEHRKRT
jgi:hypothetical protein